MCAQSRLQLVIISTIGALLYSCAVIAAPFAYVGNNERKLFVIDTATNTVTATLPMPESVSGIAVSPDGRRVYAANSKQVFVIDSGTNKILADIPTGTGPYGLTGIAINPAGTRVYVTSNWDQSVLKVIDTRDNSVVSTIDFGRGSIPVGVAVHPNGRRIYVAEGGSGSLAVIDAATNAVIKEISLAGPCRLPSPWGVAVDPAGSRIYVADQGCSDALGKSYIYVIDAASETVLASVGTAVTSARGLTVSPDGTRLYVSNGAVVDTGSLSVLGQMSALSFIGIAIHPDGSRVYVHAGASVGVVDARTLTTITWINVGGITYVLGQFVGPMAPAPATVMPTIEYFHAKFDHYFITWMPGEIAKLDAGARSRAGRARATRSRPTRPRRPAPRRCAATTSRRRWATRTSSAAARWSATKRGRRTRASCWRTRASCRCACRRLASVRRTRRRCTGCLATGRTPTTAT